MKRCLTMRTPRGVFRMRGDFHPRRSRAAPKMHLFSTLLFFVFTASLYRK